ncbi:MAG: hypothetical protein ABIM74_06595 [candidate division WOR-3 bacterium]
MIKAIFLITFIPSLTSYERRYSVFTKALLCLERSRGGYARLSCIRTCFWGMRVCEISRGANWRGNRVHLR